MCLDGGGQSNDLIKLFEIAEKHFSEFSRFIYFFKNHFKDYFLVIENTVYKNVYGINS